jgi:hypothetical protein
MSEAFARLRSLAPKEESRKGTGLKTGHYKSTENPGAEKLRWRRKAAVTWAENPTRKDGVWGTRDKRTELKRAQCIVPLHRQPENRYAISVLAAGVKGRSLASFEMTVTYAHGSMVGGLGWSGGAVARRRISG